MYIRINNKWEKLGCDVDFNSFCNFIKTNLPLKFNFDNNEIINKIKETYYKLIDECGKLTLKLFKTKFYEVYGLKYKTNDTPGLIERGFTLDETYYIHKQEVEDFLHTNGFITVKFGNTKYTSTEVPVCKKCNNDVNFRFNDKKGLFTIINCRNSECATHNSNNSKYEAFLPENKTNEIKISSRKNNRLCVEYWTSRGYTEDEAIKLISEQQKKSSACVVNRSSIKKGEIDDIFFREKSCFCIEYWVKRGYTEDEGKNKISELQSKLNKRVLKRKSPKTIDYWVNNGFSENEAREKISEIQSTFSLEKCIEKYGETDGYKRWKQRQEKWQKSLHENGNLHIGYSAVSQELFNEILKHYPEEERDYVFYGSKNKEYSIKNKENNYYYAYDFTDLNRRKIIEFNGDIYHANPMLYKPTDRPNPYHLDKTAQDLWKMDEKKSNLAKDNGFSVLTIWEYDYTKNKDRIIKDCLCFIYG